MHDINFHIRLDEITKIEGDAGLDVVVVDNKIENVQFKIQEYKRFYTQGMRGKKAEIAPQFVARICGTCSNAHLLASTEAVEKALCINVTPQTRILKKLMINGLMIRDHALHLYIFALPDILHIDSIVDLDENDPLQKQYLEDMLEVKSVGNELQEYIAGRSVHAPYIAVGGFTKIPTTPSGELISKLQHSRPAVLRLIKIFAEDKDVLMRKTTYAALKADSQWSFLEGDIHTSDGMHIPEKDFANHLEHVVLPYSQASGYKYKGDSYMTGALARLNLNKELLHEKTKLDASSYISYFPTENVFFNNVAQAIEILHCIDESIDILSNTSFKQEERVKSEVQDGEGVGVIEAPRGLLFYKLIIKEGTVVDGNIVIPTGQNQANIEKDIGKLIEQNLSLEQKEIEYKIEKLIRAYDPCMSCASHFLKVKWHKS